MSPYIPPGVHNSLRMPVTGIGPPNIVGKKKKKTLGANMRTKNENSLFISREEEEEGPLGTSIHSVSTK